MSEQKQQNQQKQTNSYNVSAKQTYRRSLTRKDPISGKSNYPTLIMTKTISNYYNNAKRTILRNYRKLTPSVNYQRN